MSFWTRIGLVDKKTFMTLQDEMQALRNDNMVMHEKNTKLIELLSANIAEFHQLIDSESVKISQNMEGYFEKTQSSIESVLYEVKVLQSQLGNLNDKLSSYKEEFSSEIYNVKENETILKSDVIDRLSELQESITVLLAEIKVDDNNISKLIVDNQEQVNNCKDRLESIVNQVSCIDRSSLTIEEMNNKLLVISESIRDLWAIVKAVWVDSVLNDIDAAI